MSVVDASPSIRRRLWAKSLLRALFTTVGLVAIYYVLPLTRVAGGGAVVLLVAGLLAVTGLIIWEVRAILKAEFPAATAIEALAIITPMFLLLFATTYFLIDRSAPASFTQQMSRTDALYFTVTTFSTVGYGDITARTEAARILVTVQMVSDLIVLGFGIRVVLGAVQRSRNRVGSINSHPADPTVVPPTLPGRSGSD